jgi:sphingomyelin phosphodiesterase acid-like 3
MKPLFAMLSALCLVLAVPAALSASQRSGPMGSQAWLLVSDIHLNPFDKSSVPSTYGSDSNWALWQSALREMRRADPDPPLVIISGDFLAHHFAALVSANGSADVAGAAETAMRRIAESVKRTFPRAQALVVLGNNDDACGDYHTAPNSPYLHAIARIWAPLVDRGGAAPNFVATFSRGGYYVATLPVRGLQAIAVDDVFWSILYHACGKANDAAQAELTWLDGALAATPPAMRDVVVMHIPPGIDSSATLFARRFVVIPYLNPTDERRLTSDFAAERSHVDFAIAGHTHRMDFRLVSGVPMLIAPAISPIYGNNPAFAVLRVTSAGALRDYLVYAYSPQRKRWAPEFDFDRTYRVRAFDAATLAQAHARIALDPSVRARWSKALVAGGPQEEVNAASWRAVWCAQTLAGRGYAICAHLRRRLLVLPIAAGLLFVIVVASIVLIAARLSGWGRR